VTRVVVIGGGIAGVAAAAHLAPEADVTVLEMESTLAYHTTGRSAATFIVNYGAEGSRPLARASLTFLESPPGDIADFDLLSDRGAFWIADERQLSTLEQIAEEGEASGAGSKLVEARQVLDLVPKLRPGYVAAGLWEPSARDIDVAGLHQVFVRMARRHGTEIKTRSPVTEIRVDGAGWAVTTPGGTFECDAVVNAGGAWGDRVAAMAGIEPIGLQPMRRTAFMVPGHEEYREWPLVVDVDDRFYFRPDGVQLLCSLAEENPDDPGDVQAREEDVALAIERINQATTLNIRSVSSQWAGLRTFAPDRDLVIGEEPTAPGFFWLVGQGGTGIMTAPAYGALLASQILAKPLPEELAAAGVDPHKTSPDRFRG
jgi:D-arginine dehydrogenase